MTNVRLARIRWFGSARRLSQSLRTGSHPRGPQEKGPTHRLECPDDCSACAQPWRHRGNQQCEKLSKGQRTQAGELDGLNCPACRMPEAFLGALFRRTSENPRFHAGRRTLFDSPPLHIEAAIVVTDSDRGVMAMVAKPDSAAIVALVKHDFAQTQ